MEDKERLIRKAKYISRLYGISPQEAMRIALTTAPIHDGSGMGEAMDLPEMEPELIGTDAAGNPIFSTISEVKAQVSPWLWSLSIISFWMALVNSRRIARMFGGWRKGKKALKEA